MSLKGFKGYHWSRTYQQHTSERRLDTLVMCCLKYVRSKWLFFIRLFWHLNHCIKFLNCLKNLKFWVLLNRLYARSITILICQQWTSSQALAVLSSINCTFMRASVCYLDYYRRLNQIVEPFNANCRVECRKFMDAHSSIKFRIQNSI